MWLSKSLQISLLLFVCQMGHGEHHSAPTSRPKFSDNFGLSNLPTLSKGYRRTRHLTASQLLNLFVTSGQILANALALSFITTSVRDSWDQPIVLFVVKMPSQYFPYVILFLTLILDTPKSMMIQATGLVSAHLYDLLTGLYPRTGIKRNFIETPAFVKKMFGTQAVVDRPYGTVITGVLGESAWGLDMSWKRFGPGRTLGGEAGSVERQRPQGLVLAAIVMGGFVAVCLFLFGSWWLFYPSGPHGPFVGKASDVVPPL